MNAAALARSLDRILVLPRWECHCDRHWTPLIPACIMTNSDLKLPFTCPMDHLLEVHKWTEQNHVQVREVRASSLAPPRPALLPRRHQARFTVIGTVRLAYAGVQRRTIGSSIAFPPASSALHARASWVHTHTAWMPYTHL